MLYFYVIQQHNIIYYKSHVRENNLILNSNMYNIMVTCSYFLSVNVLYVRWPLGTVPLYEFLKVNVFADLVLSVFLSTFSVPLSNYLSISMGIQESLAVIVKYNINLYTILYFYGP